MAIVASPQSHKQLDFRGSGHNTIHSPHSSGLMTEIMSYQYPPPPPNGAEMGLAPTGYMPAYDGLSHSGEMGMKPEYDHGYAPRDRRDSMIKAMKLKRVMSTPNVRQEMPQSMQVQPPYGQRQDDHSSMLQDGKKRNKLGYHRISVACNHCRRRKIRCIISPDDPEGRCINCIRLKKVCTFSAVDTQLAPEPRGKPGSRSASVTVTGKSSSATASPAIPQTGGHPGEMPYPSHLGIPSLQNMAPPPALKTTGDGFSPQNKLPATVPTTRTFEYGHAGITNWMGPDTSPNTSKPGELSSNWRSYAHESPVTPVTFSPYSAHAPTPSTSWASPTTTDHSSAWGSYPAPQPRSMSFGSDGMSSSSPQNQQQQQQQQQQHYPSISQMAGPGTTRHYERKTSGPMPTTDMYPQPIATGVETVPGTTLDHGVSLSAGAVPPASYGTWHHSYTYAAKPDAAYQGWYGESGSSQPLGSNGQVVHPAGGESHHHQQHAGALYYPGR